MMQQRLKAKLMVVRWGSEAVPGAGWVSNVSKAPWKRGRRQSPPWQGWWAGRQWAGPCKAGGHRVGLAGSGSEMSVLPFPLDPAEKSVFMIRVIWGLASHGSHSFPPELLKGHKHCCIFVLSVLRSGLSCCPPTGSYGSILRGEFILTYSQPHN